jgi:hypothetical protein
VKPSTRRRGAERRGGLGRRRARRFVTPELIRRTTYTATEAELKERFAALAAAGYSKLAVQIVPGQEHAIGIGDAHNCLTGWLLDRMHRDASIRVPGR